MIGQRIPEKKILEDYYEYNENAVVVAYGRNGNQVSEMAVDFAKDKKSLFFYAVPSSEKELGRYFGAEVARKYGIKANLETFEDAFRTLDIEESGRLVLIIDEFHNLIKKDGAFIQDLFAYLDSRTERSKVLVILCSTSVSWVENNMADYFAVAGHSISGFLKVKEYKFLDAVRIFPNATVRQCIQLYGILGGVADYMECWDPAQSFKQNICNQILSPKGYLYNEAENYLKTELRETALYETILAAIASGKNKLNDLYKYTGFSRAKISVYMNNLMAFDVIEKVYSFETGGWENAQKGIYQIKDTYLNFWYRFVYPNKSALLQMSANDFYERYISLELDEYMNRYFAKVCMEYLELLGKVGELPLEIHKIGTWRGKEGSIDIIMQNDVRENLVAICNWSRGEMNYGVLPKLYKTMELARIKANYIYLFSAGTFDVKLIDAANADPSIRLIDMNSL